MNEKLQAQLDSAKEGSQDGIVVESEKVIETKVGVALDSMIYTFLSILAIAVIIGVAIGSICILTCMRCYRKDQKKRLEEAQRIFNQRDGSTIGPFVN